MLAGPECSWSCQFSCCTSEWLRWMRELTDEESDAAHTSVSEDCSHPFYEKKQLPIFLRNDGWKLYLSFNKQKDPCLYLFLDTTTAQYIFSSQILVSLMTLWLNHEKCILLVGCKICMLLWLLIFIIFFQCQAPCILKIHLFYTCLKFFIV